MRLTLVGADVEENLGMGMIAAAATLIRNLRWPNGANVARY